MNTELERMRKRAGEVFQVAVAEFTLRQERREGE